MTELYAPKEYWLLTKEEKSRICNGCGPGGWKGKYIPDHLIRISIHHACDIHDYMYSVGIDERSREEADRVFLNNMLRLVESESKIWITRNIRRRLALDYYSVVRDHGAQYFWDDKNLPETMGGV